MEKDLEIARLKEENEALKQRLSTGIGYYPTLEEAAMIEAAKETHRNIYTYGHDRHSYVMTPTEEGTLVEVVCLDCQGIVFSEYCGQN